MLFQETHPGEWPSIRETKCKNLVLPRACLGVLIPVWSSWISHTAWFLCEEPGNFLMHYLSLNGFSLPSLSPWYHSPGSPLCLQASLWQALQLPMCTSWQAPLVFCSLVLFFCFTHREHSALSASPSGMKQLPWNQQPMRTWWCFQRWLHHELRKSSEKHPCSFSDFPSSKVMVLYYQKKKKKENKEKKENLEVQNRGCSLLWWVWIKPFLWGCSWVPCGWIWKPFWSQRCVASSRKKAKQQTNKKKNKTQTH